MRVSFSVSVRELNLSSRRRCVVLKGEPKKYQHECCQCDRYCSVARHLGRVAMCCASRDFVMQCRECASPAGSNHPTGGLPCPASPLVCRKLSMYMCCHLPILADEYFSSPTIVVSEHQGPQATDGLSLQANASFLTQS